MTKDVYLGLGSNLGDKAANLRAALDALENHPAIRCVRHSSFYETSPLNGGDQPEYLNAVVQIKTTLAPSALLAAMLSIEAHLGRVRTERWQPRKIDLDMLLYGDEVLDSPTLSIPHPQMHLRSFVLRGLCELDGSVMHPVMRRSAAELSSRLNGRDFYPDGARPQLISIAGMIGVGKTTLATRLAECLHAALISEKYNENPYLAEVYEGRQDKALDSELFFLSSSATQLRGDRLKDGLRYVSDYVFDKALIYASSWLKGDDLRCYKSHYECVAEAVAEPVLTIYLNDSVEQCLERIHKRNRPYEQRIEPEFLAELSRKYEALYAEWTDCPVVRMTAADCVNPEQVAVWAEELQHYLTTKKK